MGVFRNYIALKKGPSNTSSIAEQKETKQKWVEKKTELK